MAEQARASYENVVIAEYRLLNALVTNPMNFNDPRVTEYLFCRCSGTVFVQSVAGA